MQPVQHQDKTSMLATCQFIQGCHIPGLKSRSVRPGYADQTGQTRIIKISGSDLDSVLTTLLEYFDLLSDALKVQSSFLFVIV